MTRRQSSKRFLQRLTASCLICTLSWGPPLASLANDITPDGATQTTIDQAQNGVRVVNIAPPTQGGVSHNKYTDFNVRQTGAIMNNSRQVGGSQLGGALPANPHYSDRTAQIILNEVTSNNRSQLKGYTEIFGDRAEFILANPNGITCAGCGFINTSRLGLVTGKRPSWTKSVAWMDSPSARATCSSKDWGSTPKMFAMSTSSRASPRSRGNSSPERN